MENDMAASEKEQIELDMKAVRQFAGKYHGLSSFNLGKL